MSDYRKFHQHYRELVITHRNPGNLQDNGHQLTQINNIRVL